MKHKKTSKGQLQLQVQRKLLYRGPTKYVAKSLIKGNREIRILPGIKICRWRTSKIYIPGLTRAVDLKHGCRLLVSCSLDKLVERKALGFSESPLVGPSKQVSPVFSPSYRGVETIFIGASIRKLHMFK